MARNFGVFTRLGPKVTRIGRFCHKVNNSGFSGEGFEFEVCAWVTNYTEGWNTQNWPFGSTIL